MSRNAKITNYIFALVVLYFGGPALIWGTNGVFGAFLVMAIAVIGAMVWAVIYSVVEFNDE
jgi:hypothetical protein